MTNLQIRDMIDYQNMKFTLGPECARGLSARGVGRSDHQLNTYDWLADVPGNAESTDLVEVQFKNTRKAYYHNVNGLDLKKGDWVAVEANPGHDIGVVSMTGRLVTLQIKKANLKSAEDIRKVYRFAKDTDMDRYHEAKSREEATMIQSRQIAKDLAAAFHVRIEMKQIGARQEAGRIGGTGPCGRELCCATWMKAFSSVSTNAARYQDISPNPQKLAGMCAKLKCCLNYEVDCYMEAGNKMPKKDIVLQTMDSDYYLFKQDILAQMLTYSTDKKKPVNLETISVKRAHEIIAMNKEGRKPLSLADDGKAKETERPKDMLDGSDLTRFDKAKKKKKKKKHNSQ